MPRKSALWLSHSLISFPHIGLCISEEQFRGAYKKLKISQREYPDSWIPDGKDACVYTTEALSADGGSGSRAEVVCMRVRKGVDPVEVVGLLIHESVHIWQRHCEHMGETKPSREFEAYSIQSIAQSLIEEYEKLAEKSKKVGKEKKARKSHDCT